MHLHAAEWEVEIASNVYVADMERLWTVSEEQCPYVSAMNTVNRNVLCDLHGRYYDQRVQGRPFAQRWSSTLWKHDRARHCYGALAEDWRMPTVTIARYLAPQMTHLQAAWGCPLRRWWRNSGQRHRRDFRVLRKQWVTVQYTASRHWAPVAICAECQGLCVAPTRSRGIPKRTCIHIHNGGQAAGHVLWNLMWQFFVLWYIMMEEIKWTLLLWQWCMGGRTW